ncbi:G2/M phase-specific E3 ubiquitin-protein ligase-like isoform X2 [Acipenser ruthenus]|uniref:G2/M phase-specific E3 ubiquitin-protein ligase-like isoform X2 n=1 Tax=Acipenser ruthenus TaxID=7906 RepID=UPI002740BFB2|nr:G2/M phase-specific E3 ubiquitin-protein ligase-like isoform X2 [Acipenser ruthenus]
MSSHSNSNVARGIAEEIINNPEILQRLESALNGKNNRMPTTRQETSTIDEEVRQLFQGRNVVADRPAQNNSPAFNMQRNFIRAGAVPGILNRRARFEIMVTLHNKLIKPSLEQDQKMNGLLLNKIFKDKTVCLRPSLQLLVVPANAKKNRGTLSNNDDDDIEIDLTDSSPPMNSLNVTVLQVIEDAPSELIDAPYSTAGSDGPLIITEEENATVSRVLDCPSEWQYAALFVDEELSESFEDPIPLSTGIETSHHERDIGDILCELASQIDTENVSLFNISRNHLWEGAKRGFKKKTFLPCKRLSVKFMDDIGVSEGAVDLGGPRREFLTMLMESLHQGSLFVGPDHAKFLNYISGLMVSDDYFYVGMTIATSLVHGGPGPQFLSPVLFEALSSTPESTFVAVQDIPDMDIRNYLEKLLTYQEEHSNTANLFEPIQTLMQLAGTHKVIRNADDYRKIAEETAHWYIFRRTRAAFERLKEGLKTLGVLDAMTKYPNAFKHVMCYTEDTLTAKTFDIFRPVLHPLGSNKRGTENLVLSHWKDFIQELQDEPSDVTLKSLLFFITGCKTVPPLGFRPEPTVDFLHDAEDNGEKSRFPKANTCNCTLFLPTVHVVYEEFTEAMRYAVLNCQGFGFA